ATWPQEVRSLASQYLQDGLRIQIGSEEVLANPRITQVFDVFPHVPTMDQRLEKLHQLLERYHTPKQPQNKELVFANTKTAAAFVVDFLAECVVWPSFLSLARPPPPPVALRDVPTTTQSLV